MTNNLSIQTNSTWAHHKPRDYSGKLTRPIVPLSRDYEGMTHVISHQHTWSQLAYSCAGVMHIETDSGLFVLPPEQALWLPPNVRHQHFCKNKVSYRSLHIDAKLSESLGDKVRPLTIDPLLRSIILEMSTWPKDYIETEQTKRLSLVLIDRLSVAKSNQLFMPLAQDRRLIQIIDAFNQDPSNKLTIEAWAQKVGASSRTLNRLFNQNFGMGFSRWKQKIRILKSLELLTSNMTLSDISIQLGYQSTAAFITAFKKQLGCAPKKYLNKQG